MIRSSIHFLPHLVALPILAVGIAPPATFAGLSIIGEHSPADDLDTPQFFDNTPQEDPDDDGMYEGNEGVQEFILWGGNGGFDPPSTFNQHTLEEGDSNKVNIEIGMEAFGRMDLDFGSVLRYGHLVLGGSKDDANPVGSTFTGATTGIGIATISDFGTVYNNDPLTLPSTFEAYNDPSDRDEGQGWDVYVGLTGTGRLEILNGGRLEIEDTLYVGLAEGSSGVVVVDGLGSVIAQRGLKEPGEEGDPEDRGSQAMYIGALGSGTMQITNGGIVNANGGLGIGTLEVAGSLSSLFPAAESDGGNGNLVISGLGSEMRAAVGVTLGAYEENPEQYFTTSQLGSSLTITDQGLLNVVAGEQNDVDFEVARYSEVVLDNGRIVVEGGRFFHDGITRGSGRLTSQTFNNRRFGEITVNEGDRLRFTSNADTDEADTDLAGTYFMANSGLIDVLGGEIIFERPFVTGLTGRDDRFLNRVEPGIALLPDARGRIHGQNATIRFLSGLLNTGVLSFTAGDNVVSGDVTNGVGGNILISGNANAVFTDDLINEGVLELAPDGTAVSVTVLGDFVGMVDGSLSLALGGGPTGFLLSTISVAGDVILGGELNVDLSANGVTPLDPMLGDEFEIISGGGILSGAFDVLNLPTLSTGLTWGIDTSNSDFTLVVIQDGMAVGADFNGDGVVNIDDFNIWQTNFGITVGATPELGDADGDGDVDGTDYLLWLEQLGGAGVPAIATVVPEPTSALLLASLVLVAGVAIRRRGH